MSPLKIAAGLGSLISVGGLGFLGAYEGTKKTIVDGLKERRMISGVGSGSKFAWIKLLIKLRNNDKDQPNPRTNDFSSLKQEISKGEFNNDNFSKLKNLCEGIKNETYSTIISSKEDLLKDAEDFCTLKIEEVLDKSKLFSTDEKNNNDKESLKDKLSDLSSHNFSTYGELDKGLKAISLEVKIPEDEDGWKKLAKWCASSYKKTFLNENEPLLKQVIKYCGKQGISFSR